MNLSWTSLYSPCDLHHDSSYTTSNFLPRADPCYSNTAHLQTVRFCSLFSNLKSGGKVPFLGIRKRVKTSNLTENAFTHIAAGQTIEITVDVATVHDLSVGGTFKVSSRGALPFAPHGSTTLSNEALAYSSNELEVNIDGATAAKVKRAIQPLDRRTRLQSDCTGTRETNTRQALQNCQQLASVAAGQASTGSASKFVFPFLLLARHQT